MTLDKELLRNIEADLLDRYGVIIGNDDLRLVLGYPSMDAMRQAISRKTAPVPIFSVGERRGKFALAKDVARWIVQAREAAAKEPQSRSLSITSKRRVGV